VHCLSSLGSRDPGFESHSGHAGLVFVYVCEFFYVCVQVEALRRADHPPKEFYRLSLIKKLRKLSPMLQKREQVPKCGSNEEGKKMHHTQGPKIILQSSENRYKGVKWIKLAYDGLGIKRASLITRRYINAASTFSEHCTQFLIYQNSSISVVTAACCVGAWGGEGCWAVQHILLPIH
jgi:hypothetical protein